MRFLRIVLWVTCLAVISSCAHVVNPDGGAKDSKSPSLVKAIPANASTAIQPKEIRLQFDEYLQLLNTDAVIISPPLANIPTIKAKNKSIRVTLEDTLLPNTTYSINFGDAITDITERNSVKNFSYVFSTGAFLDTAFVAGTLKDAYSGKALKDYLVMLYMDFDDSVPAKHMPYYFTKTDAEGRWRINNVKETQYRVFALKDENSNFLFDQVTEPIAFADTLTRATANGMIVPLFAFKNESDKVRLESNKTIAAGIQQLIWSKSLGSSTPNIRFLSKKAQGSICFSRHMDTAYVYTSSYARDSVMLELSYANNRDTIAWEIRTDEDSLQWKKKFKATALLNTQVASRMTKSNVAVQSFLPNQNICVRFNRPLQRDLINASGVYLVKDSSTSIRIHIDSTTLSADSMQLQIANARLNSWNDFKLVLPANNWYDTLKFNLHRASEEERASLQLHFDKTSSKAIVFLLLNEQIVYRFSASSADISLKHVWPGTYKVMILQDENANGRWDTGNYFQHRQAEKIQFLPNTIQVKGNWEVVQEIKIPD